MEDDIKYLLVSIVSLILFIFLLVRDIKEMLNGEIYRDSAWIRGKFFILSLLIISIICFLHFLHYLDYLK